MYSNQESELLAERQRSSSHNQASNFNNIANPGDAAVKQMERVNT